MVCLDLLLIKKKLDCFLLLSCKDFLIYFGFKVFIRYLIFSQSVICLFIPLTVSFEEQKFLDFDKIPFTLFFLMDKVSNVFSLYFLLEMLQLLYTFRPRIYFFSSHFLTEV